MMLRASIQLTGGDPSTVNLRSVVDGDVESGVPHGELLAAFGEALVRRDPALDGLRERIVAELGAAGVVEAAGVAANFQRMVRIADGIGIPLDEGSRERSAGLRAELEIERFASAANTRPARGD